MTRLIDADALKADIEQFNRPLCDDYHIKDYVLNQIISDIENQPTVEAFPLEWLINRYAYATEDILVEWENYLKEQSERKEE